MSALKKVIQTAAEAALDAKRVAKGAKSGGNLLNAPSKGTFDALDDLTEYERVAGKLDADAPHAQIRREVEEADQKAAEAARKDAIENPEAQPTINLQANDPEEFAARLNGQLRDPGYSARSVLATGDEVGDLGHTRASIDAGHATPQEEMLVRTLDDITGAQVRHKKMVESILTPLASNKRWKAATDEWMGDSPYSGDLQFHVDRFTDPTRKDSFIQLKEPRELGIHSGSNDAAETAGLRHGADDAIKNQEEQAQAIAQVAGTLEEPLVAIERSFAQATNRHFTRLFSKNGDVDVWAEIEDIMEDFVEIAGVPVSDIAKFKSGMRQLPTPNTTPFLFRGKNGLLLEDNGGFGTDAVARQLESIFNTDESFLAIQAALGESHTAARQKALQKFIESKGYDHAIYHNSVEDKGSLSIINWNPDLMASPWDARFHRNNASQASAATAYLMAMMGFGGVDVLLRDSQQGT